MRQRETIRRNVYTTHELVYELQTNRGLKNIALVLPVVRIKEMHLSTELRNEMKVPLHATYIEHTVAI